jgi:hypothetical protein
VDLAGQTSLTITKLTATCLVSDSKLQDSSWRSKYMICVDFAENTVHQFWRRLLMLSSLTFPQHMMFYLYVKSWLSRYVRYVHR